MASNPHKFTGDGFALRLAILYAALVLTLGMRVPLGFEAAAARLGSE